MLVDIRALIASANKLADENCKEEAVAVIERIYSYYEGLLKPSDVEQETHEFDNGEPRSGILRD